MALFALFVTPIATLGAVHGLWAAVLIAGLALACHQGFATNIFAIAADVFPAARIGSAIGFAAFFGNAAGAGSAQLAGVLLQHYGTVTPMFFLCAGGYAAAWLLLRALSPQKA
jgi:ACS family hexuronate transporter-like MFS transporter